MMIEIVLVRQLDRTLNIYVSSGCKEVKILDLVETDTPDADIKSDGCNYLIQQILQASDMVFDAEMANKLMKNGIKALKDQEYAKLESEYEELSSEMANLETQISENLEKQKKLTKGEENGDSGQGKRNHPE